MRVLQNTLKAGHGRPAELRGISEFEQFVRLTETTLFVSRPLKKPGTAFSTVSIRAGDLALDLIMELATPITMGILVGGLYTLIALGLSLVFGVMKLINVAHGDLVILGSYFAYSVMTYMGIDPILSLVMGIPLLFIVGYIIQKYLMAKAFRRSMEAPLIIAFGISLVLENTMQAIFSPMSKGLSTSYSMESLIIGEIYIPYVYLLSFGVAILVMIALGLFFKKTYLGQAIIAASQDEGAAQLLGVNTPRIFAFTFGLAAAISAVAGVFLGLTFPFHTGVWDFLSYHRLRSCHPGRFGKHHRNRRWRDHSWRDPSISRGIHRRFRPDAFSLHYSPGYTGR